MSKPALLFGLLLSLVFHWTLLGIGQPSTEDESIDRLKDENQIAKVPPAVEVVTLPPKRPDPPAPKVQEPRAPKPTPPEPIAAQSQKPEKQKVKDSEPPPPPVPPKPMAAPQRTPPAAAQPPMQAMVSKQHSDLPAGGDFSGSRSVPRRPELRIDWGTENDAIAALNAGRMKLVVIEEATTTILRELIHRDGAWQSGPYQPQVGVVYSNSLRMVQKVPAFAPARRAASLRPGEKLAVLVPQDVEQKLQSAQLTAAFRKNLTLQHVRNFGGRYRVTADELSFEITRIEQRRPRP